MQKVLLDSNIISYFLRGEPSVITELEKYQESFEQITFSILTYYEIVSGLKHRDSKKILTIFKELASESEILAFDQDTASISSNIYCDLRQRGLLVPPTDIFIGATALQHDLNLVTANIKHFRIMKNLKYLNWMTSSY
ncbi:MAG: type II toxin-antitoxin system VapC family toxin [Pseudanabaena sp. CAN_BIN31]|nr:type II toxin-antitoxin system VapC family toxin [Pseudanabaena sp. CAN_BIN31]